MDNFLIISKKKINKDNFDLKNNFYFSKKINKKVIKKINPKIIFFIYWSTIVKEDIFDKYTCIQFHSSDLPKFKGGSPIQNQIIKGINQTKISAFKMNSNLDSGNICMKRKVSLKGSAQEIYKRIEKIALKMIFQISKMKKIKFIKPRGKSSYFVRRKPAQSNLKQIKFFNLSKIYDFIRMLDAKDYPKAFLVIGKNKITFTDAKNYKKFISGKYKIEKNINENR